MTMLSLFTPLRRFIVAAFLMDLATGAIGIALQFMGKRLQATPLELGLIGTCSAATYTIGCLISGRLSDRFGRKLSLSFACVGAACGWAFMPHSTQPWELMVLGAWSAGCMAFFWPAYQAWMAELTVGGRRQFNRNIGMFNLAWTLGLMTGPVVTGALWPLGPRTVFWSIIGLGVCGLLLVLSTPQQVASAGAINEDDDYERAHPLAEALLRLAWIAAFAACAVGALIRTTFPNLGLTIGYSPVTVGVLVACFHFGQVITFLAARATDKWQNRRWPLAVGLAVAALAMLCAFAFRTKPVYAVAFALCGSAQAVAFVASQFYTLHGRKEGRGRVAGFHEAVVGAGFLTGPLIGGSVAQHFSLEAPYLAATFVCVAAILVGWTLWRTLAHRARARHSQPPGSILNDR